MAPDVAAAACANVIVFGFFSTTISTPSGPNIFFDFFPCIRIRGTEHRPRCPPSARPLSNVLPHVHSYTFGSPVIGSIIGGTLLGFFFFFFFALPADGPPAAPPPALAALSFFGSGSRGGPGTPGGPGTRPSTLGTPGGPGGGGTPGGPGGGGGGGLAVETGTDDATAATVLATSEMVAHAAAVEAKAVVAVAVEAARVAEDEANAEPVAGKVAEKGPATAPIT